MRELDVLPPHEHDVADIEQINPIEFARLSASVSQLSALGDPELVSLSLSVHVGVSFHPFYFINGLK